jgi:GTP cyclohydrolase I
MPGKVVDPKGTLMTAIGPDATEESRRTFPTRWQEMVKTIFDNADKGIEII